MIQYKPTKKLFYGKWLYKVSYKIEGCSFIRQKLFDDIDSSFDNLKITNIYHRKILNNREDLIRISSELKRLPRESFDLRVETDIIDVYTNDEAIFSMLITVLPEKIRFAQKPQDPTGQQLSDKKTILVKKYPQEKFKMRVYLKPHKMSDPEEKESYLLWLKSVNGVSISDAVETWFYNTNWNWDRRYILVDDEKTLLMLKLKNSNVIGTIYNLVLQD